MTKSSLCAILVTSLHRYIVTSLHRYIVTSLHRYIVTSLHRYHLLINLITPPAPRLLSGGSKRANALYCFHLVSKKLKIQSSDNASYFRAEGEDFCGTLRLDPKNIPLPLFNFKLHLSTVSLIGNWLECASSIIEKNTLWVRTRFEHGFSLCNEAFLPVNLILVLNWFSHYSNSYIFPLSSFPRRRESRKPFLTKNDKQKLRKDCMSCAGQPSLASADLVRPWVGACTDTQSFLKTKLSFLVHGLLFFRQSSFPHLPLSFLRKQESSMYFVSLTAIKLWVQGVCQKKHPLGARRRESRKSLLCDEVHYVKIQRGNFFVRRFAWTQKKFPFVFLLIIRTAKRCIRNNPLCRVVIFVLSMGFSLAQIRNYLRSFLYA